MLSLRRLRISVVAVTMAMGLLIGYSEDKVAADNGFRAHNIFQSNMVIQRSKPVDVWGWSKSGDKVTVAFAGKTVTGVAGGDGKWLATLPAMEANSTPAEMTITSAGGASMTLENVLVGDVWILGGQSNMEWGIGPTNEGNLEVASANFSNIRLLTVPKVFGAELKTNFPRAAEYGKITGKETTAGDWLVCAPETVGGMSAIGYVMARRIHMASQVPVAIVNTARGGTTVEAWTPLARLEKLDTPEVKERLLAEHKRLHHPPGNCFASVISPLSGFAVKGAIFHQGYNNCFGGVPGARMYRAVFPEMIKGWREAFKDEAMPFCILSQCTAGKQQTHDSFLIHLTDIGARLREIQYQTFLDFQKAGDKNIGFVSTYDLRHSNFHPRVKIPAGERAAIWALVSQYGVENGLEWQPPTLKEMKAVDGALELTYDMGIGDNSDGTGMSGFAIAGEDMKFQPAKVGHKVTGKNGRKATYDRNTLVLTSPLVEKPIHYRYAWARNPMGDVQRSVRFGNRVMLPTQRSDKWSNADLLKALTGKEEDDSVKLSKGGNNALRAALAKEDERRKLAEATAILNAAEQKQAASK